MLCLLNLTGPASGADLLLMSAMMKNTAEIAGWLGDITGRECLALDLAWKPTRQARGCVVYDMAQLNALRDRLRAARTEKPKQKSVPAKVKRELTAQPFGFFGLRQTWSTKAREDYALRALLETPEPLGTSSGTNWYLTPNGNQVSTAIAAGSVEAGMKTLVFVQNTVACGSCVRAFANHMTPREVSLTEEEAGWRALVVEEMGGAEHCYLAVDEGSKVRTGAASHHGLLLRDERELHESLFRRRDGIDALFATSTLAQGMNLPSEVVIICGDSRFDPNVDKLKQLEAHELLNAAGRAGRAGEGAQGFVLLVPSHVIGFDQAKSLISSDWMDLQAIFEQSDQCLIIDDPLAAALDVIHTGITQSGAGAYLLGRLPVSVTAGEPDPAEAMLKRTFAAYRRKQAGDEAWISSRINAALAARPAAAEEAFRWIGLVAASTGQSIDLLEGVLALVDGGALEGDAGQVIAALLGWIEQMPARLLELVRPESLEGLFGEAYKKLPTDEARALEALEMIRRILPVWMSGAPVRDIEWAIQGKATGLGYCETARHFVTRVAPDLAFVAGLPARLLLARHAATTPMIRRRSRRYWRPSEALCAKGATHRNHSRCVSRLAARSPEWQLAACSMWRLPISSPVHRPKLLRPRKRGSETRWPSPCSKISTPFLPTRRPLPKRVVRGHSATRPSFTRGTPGRSSRRSQIPVSELRSTTGYLGDLLRIEARMQRVTEEHAKT